MKRKFIWGIAAFCLLSPLSLLAQETAAFFKQNCASCHTIGGGRLTGPDLKDLAERKNPADPADREWLIEFIMRPKDVIDSGDPYAQKILEESRGVVMPEIHGLTRAKVEALLELIETEAKLPKSQFAGMKISDRPFTQQDIEDGRAYFTGVKRLANGGASCISCHTVDGIGGLGGGKLGPDLTKVYEKLQGRQTVAAWLSAPATPTMLPIYKKHPLTDNEILALTAYLEQSANTSTQADPTVAKINFLLLGLGGTVIGLVLFDLLWRKRFRGVRRPLVHGPATRETI